MRRVLDERDRVDGRVLGALRLVDGTTFAPIDERFVVEAVGARLTRNRSGLYVVCEWSALAAHDDAFEAPPAAPAIGSELLRLEVRDPRGRYLDRQVTLALPRDPDPTRADAADSLFQAVNVPMYPATSAPVHGNWVELRAAVRESATGDALGGALLRVVTGARVLARGLTDWRGEALIPVAGVPVTTWSTEPGAVVVTEIAASLECYVDAVSGTRTPLTDVRDGRTPRRLPRPNPDGMEIARATLPQSATPVVLAAGRRLTVAITVPVP